MQGRNVVLESKFGSPKIVNDGVTIAREVELEDPVENIGAKLVRQVRAWPPVWLRTDSKNSEAPTSFCMVSCGRTHGWSQARAHPPHTARSVAVAALSVAESGSKA